MRLLGIAGNSGVGKDTAAACLINKHNFVRVAFADAIKRAAMEFLDFSEDQMFGPSAMRNAPDKRYVRERHDRHEWLHGSNEEWTCDRCGANGKDAGTTPHCIVYLTPRHFLQQLGTEVGRKCYENIWVDYAVRTANKLLTPDPSGVALTYDPTIGLVGTTDRMPVLKGVVISDVRFLNEVKAIKESGGKVIRITRKLAESKLSATEATHESEKLDIPAKLYDRVIENDGTIEELGTSLSAFLASWE